MVAAPTSAKCTASAQPSPSTSVRFSEEVEKSRGCQRRARRPSRRRPPRRESRRKGRRATPRSRSRTTRSASGTTLSIFLRRGNFGEAFGFTSKTNYATSYLKMVPLKAVGRNPRERWHCTAPGTEKTLGKLKKKRKRRQRRGETSRGLRRVM